MRKYIAQPQFMANTVNVYDITPGNAPALFMTLTPSSAITDLVGPFTFASPAGPNSVLIYQDFAAAPSPLTSSPQQLLLIAYVAQTNKSGAIFVFDLDALLSSGTGTAPFTVQLPDNPLVVLQLNGYNPIGMAIRPGTGDLYVATPAISGDPAISIFAKIPGGTWSANVDNTTFDYNSLNGFSTVPANLAFDGQGFLWMTSFGWHLQNPADPSSPKIPNNYLACFRIIPGSPPQSAVNLWFDNTSDNDGSGSQLGVTSLNLSVGSSSPPASLWGLSSPEGIAFDPAGNLWVANNNEEDGPSDVNPKFGDPANPVGGGSLLMIRAEYLLSLLFSAAPAEEILLSSIPAESVVAYYIDDQAQPGGLFFDGFTLYINDESNNFNPIIWQMTVNSDGTQATPLTPVASPVQTTNPGNGSMAVFNYPPFSFPDPTLAQLSIRDWSADMGIEPDDVPPPQAAWESLDIGIATSAISGVPGLGSTAGQSTPFDPANPPYTALNGTVDYASLSNDTAFVFVRVTNIDTSSRASVGGEVLKVYWAHASTALQWPAPWTGLIPDSTAATQTLGGLIGAVALDSIPTGQACLVQMLWTGVPAPLNFTDAPPGSAEQAHFCLLARIESNGLYPFGMSYPEQWNFNAGNTLLTNVEANRGVAWRNIKIQEAGASGDIRIIPGLEILGGNYGLVDKVVGFQLQTLDHNGVPASIPATVTVVAHGAARQRFLEMEHEPKLERIVQEIVDFVEDLLGLEHMGEGRFLWNDLEKGIRNLRLRPGELLPFNVEFTPETPVENFAIRVVQTEQINGNEQATGGQTFVFGTVKGYPAR